MMNSYGEQLYRQVLVVGAGPVGMTAALALRKLGLPATILEREKMDRIRPGSRAIYIHQSTLKLLEQIYPNLGFDFASRGIVWPVKRTLWRGKEVYAMRYPEPKANVLPPFTSLPQVMLEQILYKACQEAGVEFVWDTPVSEVQSDDHGVTLRADDGTVWKTEYVIGADGAHSSVRKGVNIDMEGTRSVNTFLVVDVKEDADNPLPLERIFHYQHPAIGGRNVLYVPFAGGWRIDLQLLDHDIPEEYSGMDGVKKWLPKVIDSKYVDRITWISTYQFLQVVAKDFTDEFGRSLLVGEAAHLFAPFGARGLNSGVPDAIFAANAIHAAFQTNGEHERKQAILNFSSVRQGAAKYNRDAAGIALEHLQGEAKGITLKRFVAASLAFTWPQLGRWLDEGPYGPKSGPPTISTKY